VLIDFYHMQIAASKVAGVVAPAKLPRDNVQEKFPLRLSLPPHPVAYTA